MAPPPSSSPSRCRAHESALPGHAAIAVYMLSTTNLCTSPLGSVALVSADLDQRRLINHPQVETRRSNNVRPSAARPYRSACLGPSVGRYGANLQSACRLSARLSESGSTRTANRATNRTKPRPPQSTSHTVTDKCRAASPSRIRRARARCCRVRETRRASWAFHRVTANEAAARGRDLGKLFAETASRSRPSADRRTRRRRAQASRCAAA